MRIAVLLTAVVLFPLKALADYTNTGVQIDCAPTENELRFHAEKLENEPAMWAAAPAGAREQFMREAKERGLFLETKFDVTCKLKATEFRVWGEMYEPNEFNCGADPGGKLNVSVNGVPLFASPLYVGLPCSSSIWRGSVSIPRTARAIINVKLCASDPFRRWQKEAPKCATKLVRLPKALKKQHGPLFQSDMFREIYRDG